MARPRRSEYRTSQLRLFPLRRAQTGGPRPCRRQCHQHRQELRPRGSREMAKIVRGGHSARPGAEPSPAQGPRAEKTRSLSCRAAQVWTSVAVSTQGGASSFSGRVSSGGEATFLAHVQRCSRPTWSHSSHQSSHDCDSHVYRQQLSVALRSKRKEACIGHLVYCPCSTLHVRDIRPCTG